MEVQVDKKLMDLLQGTTHLEGIGGRATVTQINNDTEALHHMELKPNKQKTQNQKTPPNNKLQTPKQHPKNTLNTN